MAILAGDALLTLAFRLRRRRVRATRAIPRPLRQVLADIADAAGTDGMVGGQVVDIESEGNAVGAGDAGLHPRAQDGGAHPRLAPGGRAALPAAAPAQVARAAARASALGLAFQIVDDILDVEGSTGSSSARPRARTSAQQKATYPGVHGLDASRARGARSADRARRSEALAPLGAPAAPIRALGRFILERKA